MNIHKNACTTARSRAMPVQRVIEEHWPFATRMAGFVSVGRTSALIQNSNWPVSIRSREPSRARSADNSWRMRILRAQNGGSRPFAVSLR